MLQKFAILITLLTLVIAESNFAQSLPDPHFSQYYGNPLYLNPALAGATICPNISLNYRNQWPALSKSFITYSASFDMYVKKISGGVGVNFIADQAGDGMLNTNMINVMYSFKFKASKHIYMSAAIQGSYIQTKLDWNALQFGEQIDPNYGYNPNIGNQETPPDKTNIGFPDFSAGITISYKDNIYGGVAVHHLTEPNNSFYSGNESKLYMKITVHGGALIDLSGKDSYDENYGKFSISPNFLYEQQYNFHKLNIGLYFTKYPFILGAWFRHNFENADALIPMAGIEYKRFIIGYSYDITLSEMKNVSGGAHEISLAYHFSCIAEKRRRIRAINCPKF
ncbi:MAG: type IX secretion system membrane protein PorP/SprF [Bacteroidetes bacterium]|nr:type IX secretion system membrane protein PorP/SprF [Bacteroidota bacterium]